MPPVFRHYTADNFMNCRQFLIDSYTETKKPYNFTLERLNFGYTMDRSMHNISEEHWAKRVGLWEEHGKIVGIVFGEGPGGDAYCQVTPAGLPVATLNEMFDFAEKNIAAEIEGELTVRLAIPEDDELRKECARNKGYQKTKWSEPLAVLNLTESRDVNLPPGYFIKTGEGFTYDELGAAHGKAFGYYDDPVYRKRSPVGYAAMQKTPDYRADQDLYVVSEQREIAAFCTIWLDEVNQIGILEPVGTHPNYRKLGLAKAVINECINRVAAKGAKQIWVGSKQPFYLAIGFKHVYNHEIWEKIFLD